MYAENAMGSKIGKWSMKEGAGFYHPGDCVVHQNADYKNYLNVFKVKLPAGAGPVVIKALVKYGLANPVKDGGFFWPNNRHLVLNEAAPTSRVWFEGANTQACTDVCAGVGGTCDLATMQLEGQSPAMFAKTNPVSTCFKPILAGCSASSPAVTPVSLPNLCSRSCVLGCVFGSQVAHFFRWGGRGEHRADHS